MARDPMYSDYLQMNPTFRFYGQSWGSGAGSKAAFERALRKHGINPAQWYRRHATAAKSFNPVEQSIYSMFQPQLSAIDAERRRTAEMWGRRMQNLTGFSAALMPYLQQVPGAIMGPYREGASGVQSLGGIQGKILNADSAAEAQGMNDVLSTIGSPQSIASSDAGAILAGLGGMEGDLMRAAGGAYGAAASQLPKTASLEQAQMMKDLLSGAAEADKSFSDQVLGVLQGLPGARQQFGQQSREDSLRKQKFALDKLESERDWYLKQAALAAAQGDDARSEKYLKLAQDRERRYQLAQQGYDTEGNLLPGYKTNAQGDIVKIGKPSTSSTTPGTPAYNRTQVANVGKAQSKIESDVNRYMESIQATDQPPKNISGYNTLRQQLWKKYQYLATTPTAKKKLRTAIDLAIRSWRPKPKKGGAAAGGSLPAPEK